MKRFLILLASWLLSCGTAQSATRPNVIYLMADELGYFEPGFMGGKNSKTPNLNRMAAEGMRFNNLVAGSSVCAPTRCSFLPGKHSGHTSVRSNGGGTPLRELVIDLGAERTIRGFVYFGRQDAGWNGAIKDVEFCVSQTADHFGAPVAKTALAKSKDPQTIPCPEVKGRYILLRALTEHGGNTFASVAELGILWEWLEA